MQIICSSLCMDNHASTSLLSFFEAGCSYWDRANSVKALREYIYTYIDIRCTKAGIRLSLAGQGTVHVNTKWYRFLGATWRDWKFGEFWWIRVNSSYSSFVEALSILYCFRDTVYNKLFAESCKKFCPTFIWHPHWGDLSGISPVSAARLAILWQADRQTQGSGIYYPDIALSSENQLMHHINKACVCRRCVSEHVNIICTIRFRLRCAKRLC